MLSTHERERETVATPPYTMRCHNARHSTLQHSAACCMRHAACHSTLHKEMSQQTAQCIAARSMQHSTACCMLQSARYMARAARVHAIRVRRWTYSCGLDLSISALCDSSASTVVREVTKARAGFPPPPPPPPLPPPPPSLAAMLVLQISASISKSEMAASGIARPANPRSFFRQALHMALCAGLL